MKFECDRQTMKDLEIFKDFRDSAPSIFNLYNFTLTQGGGDVLSDWMRKPTSDIDTLQHRVELFKYLKEQQLELSIKSSQIEYVERYIHSNTPILANNPIYVLVKGIRQWLKPTSAYYQLRTGIQQLLHLLAEISRKTNFPKDEIPTLLLENTETTRRLLEYAMIKKGLGVNKKLSVKMICILDRLFRHQLKSETLTIIIEIYHLDAFISVAKAAREREFCFPHFQNTTTPSFSIKGLRHPLLQSVVPYDVEMEAATNLYFLTGPNMAGKSTFLKSVALAIYLAHIGFPVAATAMTTSIYKGIFTTINLSDDINLGYSHFYSEVHRVKKMAITLENKRPLFVVFDELFRGTNLKDASEGSTEIIKALSRIPDSTFYVSTHIVEVADELKGIDNVRFKYFDATLKDGVPTYDYRLRDGISSERMGMYIIRREGVLDILNALGDDC